MITGVFYVAAAPWRDSPSARRNADLSPGSSRGIEELRCQSTLLFLLANQ
jgi:hypothetical protein